MRWRTLHKRKVGSAERRRLMAKAPALPALLFKFSYDGKQVAEALERFHRGLHEFVGRIQRATQTFVEAYRKGQDASKN